MLFCFVKHFFLLNPFAHILQAPHDCNFIRLCTVYIVCPVSVTLFSLIPLLLPRSEPGYDRWRGELSMGCMVVFGILFEPFLSLQMVENSNNTRVLSSAAGVFLVFCTFTLPWSMSQFKRYSWSKRTFSSHLQSPVMCPHHHYLTDPVPSVSPPLPSSRLTHHPLFCSLPVTEVASVSPPRPIIASSPLSVVVLGTNLPFALLKVVFCIGQICGCSEPQFPHLLQVIMDTSCPTALTGLLAVQMK